MIFKKKGEPVVCEHCHAKVYRFSRDVLSGESVMSSQMEDVGFGTPKKGDQIICPNCGEDLRASMGVR